MSSVFLNVGQCGIQLGQAFWNAVEERLQTAGERHPFFNVDQSQRRILVDTEPKVLNVIRKQYASKEKGSGKVPQALRPENLLASRRGRGANWAMGYSKVVEASASSGAGSGGGEAKLLGRVLESVRHEVERCDAFSGFIMMHSLSGGTGSGMGSHIVEMLCDEYPLAQRLSVCVAPSSQGENPMQSYNSVLCLQHLYEHCDGILLLENELLLRQCQAECGTASHLRPSTAASSRLSSAVTVDDLNKMAAETLAGLLLPTEAPAMSYNDWSIGLEPWELCRSICPLPSLKLFTVDHSRQTHARSWASMAEQLGKRQRHVRHGRQVDVHDHGVADLLSRSSAACSKCVAVVSVARGVRWAALDRDAAALEKCLIRCYGCVTWNPSPVTLWSAKSAGGLRGSTTLTVASCGTAVVNPVGDALDRARRMFASSAFLHWYERYGCGRERFLEAFDSVHGILDAYVESVA